MPKAVIGYVECGYCGYLEAEVKETAKMGQGQPIVMVWCPAPKCQSQYFPRGQHGSDRVRSKMRALSDVINTEIVELKPAPAAPAQEPEKPRRKTFAEELGL